MGYTIDRSYAIAHTCTCTVCLPYYMFNTNTCKERNFYENFKQCNSCSGINHFHLAISYVFSFNFFFFFFLDFLQVYNHFCYELTIHLPLINGNKVYADQMFHRKTFFSYDLYSITWNLQNLLSCNNRYCWRWVLRNVTLCLFNMHVKLTFSKSKANTRCIIQICE